jgi:transcriptional regulator with XRE-family HTH domain
VARGSARSEGARRAGPPAREDARETIGQRIRIARKASRLNQAELAEVLGVTQPTVANWEAGAHDPRQLVLPRLAEALGVSLDWLAGGEAAAARPASAVPSYLRLGVRHVPILGAGDALRVARGLDPHLAASDYLPFPYEGGTLVAVRLPEGAARETLVIVDLALAPGPGAMVVACDGEGPAIRPREAVSEASLGTVVASLRFH